MKDNIWWTRKARIKAEQRLLSNQRWMELLLLWYSLSSLFVSVWLLAGMADNQEYYPAVFTCFSIFILAFSLYGASSRFSQRAERMKENYVALQDLYLSIEAHESSSTSPSLPEHRKRYAQLLNEAENHIDFDFSKALIFEDMQSEDKSKLTKRPRAIDYFALLLGYAKRSALLVILFVIPVLLSCFSFYS